MDTSIQRNSTTERPNILYTLVDDLGWGDVSYHGSPIRTPNVDRLVRRGIELDYHYVNPVAPMHIVDWMPTFAALLGCEPPPDPQWDGVNVWPLIDRQVEQVPERPLYWNLVHRRFAVRYEGWKLIRREHESRTETELYHIREDPLEERELAARNPEIVRQLLSILERQRTLDDTSERTDVD